MLQDEFNKHTLSSSHQESRYNSLKTQMKEFMSKMRGLKNIRIIP